MTVSTRSQGLVNTTEDSSEDQMPVNNRLVSNVRVEIYFLTLNVFEGIAEAGFEKEPKRSFRINLKYV